ncbi:MAG: hypothetical protein KUG73_03305 [Pseudomonadales bacterium]|nr:hypothetical protein [Pseudomonadales bacterium]
MAGSEPAISDISLSIFVAVRDRFREQSNQSKQLRIIIRDPQGYWELVPAWNNGILTALEKHDIQESFLIRLGLLPN